MTSETTPVLETPDGAPPPPAPCACGTCTPAGNADHLPANAATVVQPSYFVRAMRWLVGSPVGIVVLFAGGVLAVDAGGTDDGAGICVFRRCTGGYCPGCGMTRAARHLTRGELSASWADHPWMVLAAAQASVLAGVWVLARWTARTIAWARPMRVLAAVNVIALVAIWIIRLTNGSIPRFF